MYHARELAMTRMEAEADALGADGIVGVRLDIEFKEFGNDLAEFIAIGTAVKADDAAAGGNWRNKHGKPFTSDLSGQDFWTLIQAGYAPLGMVHGHLRLPHRPPAVLAGDGQHRAERRDPAVHRGAVRRPRAGDEPHAGRGRAAAAPRASSACSCCRCRTAGAGTPPSSSPIGTAVRPLRADHVIAKPQLVLPADRPMSAETWSATSLGPMGDLHLIAAALRADRADVESYTRVLTGARRRAARRAWSRWSGSARWPTG